MNWAVEVLKRSLSDDYVVITDQVCSFEFANVISKTEQKVLELDRLHNLIKEKLTTATYSENIVRLTPAPDSWSRRYCVEHFSVSEYLVRTARAQKRFKWILAKPSQKQGKVISQNTIVFVLTMHEDDEFTCQTLGKKHYISIAKGVHKKILLVLCSLEKCVLTSRKNILMLSLEFPNLGHFEQNAVN